MIPLVDLGAQHSAIRSEILEAFERVLGSSRFIMGPEVAAFEEDLALALGARHAVGVASGTAALQLILVALGIGAGDAVITTPHTFVATAEAILHTGARPVFVDIDERTYNLDPALIEKHITDRTRAIMPVHLYGLPADMNKIMQIAEQHSLAVVEDAAQAHGATCDGSFVGSIGDAGAFSFYPGKNVGALGDAGAIITRRDDVADMVSQLRNHGRQSKYLHDRIGYGERLDALQAAILRVKLKHLLAWNLKRREVAQSYKAELADLPLDMPAEVDNSSHVYHLFVVRARSKQERDALRNHLGSNGIGTGIHYPVPLHLQPALAGLRYSQGDFPVTEQVCETILSLPIYPELEPGQQEYIIGKIRSFYR